MILREIEAFLREFDMKPSRFGREAAGDPRLVFELRFGARECRESTKQRIRAYMNRMRANETNK